MRIAPAKMRSWVSHRRWWYCQACGYHWELDPDLPARDCRCGRPTSITAECLYPWRCLQFRRRLEEGLKEGIFPPTNT